MAELTHTCRACSCSETRSEVHKRLLEDLQRGRITPMELRERMAMIRFQKPPEQTTK